MRYKYYHLRTGTAALFSWPPQLLLSSYFLPPYFFLIPSLISPFILVIVPTPPYIIAVYT